MPLPETQAKIDRACELRLQGSSYAQIGKELGVAVTTVRRYIHDPKRQDRKLQGRRRWPDIVPIDLAEPYWLRQKNEPPKAFAGFEAYRDMEAHERTYRKAAEQVPTNYVRVVDWSKKYRWQERIRAWDTHCEELRVQRQEMAIMDMAERQATAGLEMLAKVMQRIRGDDEDAVQAINMNLVTPQDLARLAEVAVKIERLGRGLETERIENTHGPVEVRLAFNATPNIKEGILEGSFVEAPDPPELPPAA